MLPTSVRKYPAAYLGGKKISAFLLRVKEITACQAVSRKLVVQNKSSLFFCYALNEARLFP